jgi:hypothetical protein
MVPSPLRFNPERLSWKDIADVVGERPIQKAQSALHKAVLGGDAEEIKWAAGGLVDRLNPRLAFLASSGERLWDFTEKIAKLVSPVSQIGSGLSSGVVSEVFDAVHHGSEFLTNIVDSHRNITAMREWAVLNTLREYQSDVTTIFGRPEQAK